MEITSAVIIMLLLELARSQEVATPSSQLAPRNFNHHAYEAKLKSLMGPVPTRKGPVLFPNDVPPIDNVPEIATSRPLYLTQTNTTYDQTGSANLPTFLAYSTKYQPMVFGTLPPDTGSTLSPTVGSIIEDYADSAPYTDIVKKSISPYNLDNNYIAYQLSTPLPPLYNAHSQHGDRNVFQGQQNDPSQYYKPKKPIKHNKKIDPYNAESNSEDAEGKSYAFSYTVKDQKTGDDFSHSQRSSGSATNGEYRVRLPDGRMQVVSYTADENGYKADVRYDVDSVSTIEYNSDTVKHSPEENTIYRQNPYQYSIKQYGRQQKLINNDYTLDQINDKPNKYYPGQELINDKYNQEQNQANQYNPDQNDFLQRFNRDQPVDYLSKEYDTNSGSKQYDYSSEYENRAPYKSKFAELFSSNAENVLHFSSTTSKPSYLDLGEVLAKALPNVRPTFYNLNPTERSTSDLLKNARQNLYNSADTEKEGRSLSSPLDSFVATTPRSYLVSTIASLRDRATKPVLSDSFISRINKYLSFK